MLAERSGLRIHEVPVDWVDDPDSRVDIVATAAADLKGIGRLLRGFADRLDPGQRHCRAAGFVAARGRTRVAVAAGGAVRRRRGGVDGRLRLLFMLLQGWAGAQAANLIALLLTAVGNTAANRRFTFGVGGRADAGPPPRRGSDRLRHRTGDHQRRAGRAARHRRQPHHMVELAVLVLANLVATAVRFVLLRGWVFHPRRSR